MILRVLLVASLVIVVLGLQTKQFNVNVSNVTGEWNHYWEHCVGSGHAALALRADYQRHMTRAHQELGFQQVRSHGLFVDDMSVVLPSNQGNGVKYSFFNVDSVFDFLLEIGMKPLVEISFMPHLLASGNQTWSHYDANITPPKKWDQWTDLITSFAKHLIDRYGEDEILTWNFEIWNEPNCCPHNFWIGNQTDYFFLFNVTSHALKSVHPKIRVGGPATAMSAWIPEFLAYNKMNGVPFDFITTHEYPTDPPGPQTRTFFVDQLRKTRDTVGPSIPIYYTEYDDGYNDPTSYGAAFVAYQNYNAHGIVDTLSWWVFSDIFEEQGMYPDPFDFGHGMPVDGLMNLYGIPKPSYRAFQLLHWTGDRLVDTQPDTFHSNNETLSAFTVIGNHTSIFLINWNVKNQPIESYSVEVTVSGVSSTTTSAVMYVIDSAHTTAYPLWVKMGMPMYLSKKQVMLLDDASSLVPQPLSITRLSNDRVQFTVPVPANALVNVVLL